VWKQRFILLGKKLRWMLFLLLSFSHCVDSFASSRILPLFAKNGKNNSLFNGKISDSNVPIFQLTLCTLYKSHSFCNINKNILYLEHIKSKIWRSKKQFLWDEWQGFALNHLIPFSHIKQTKSVWLTKASRSCSRWNSMNEPKRYSLRNTEKADAAKFQV
jgi:hypothetical protein